MTSGSVDVTVTEDGVTSTIVAGDVFTYIVAATGPTITLLDPDVGSPEGVVIAVTGTALDTVTGATFVAGDGTTHPAHAFNFTTSTGGTVTSPTLPVGSYLLVLTDGTHDSGSSPAAAFTATDATPPPPDLPDPSIFSPFIVPTRKWTLFCRNRSFKLDGQVEDYLQGATFIPRWNTTGTHNLAVPATSPLFAALQTPGSGIVVMADGQIVYSGVNTSRLHSRQGGVDTLTVSGFCDNWFLGARRAHPMPHNETPDHELGTPGHGFYAGAGGAYSTIWDVRTGPVSTIMQQYVQANLGSSALARRRLSVLDVGVDPAIGPTITGKGRWQNLLVFLAGLALQGTSEVGFRVLQHGQRLLFSTFAAPDKSASVIFSPDLGTVGDFAVETTAANANYVYGGGAGDFDSRLIVEYEDGTDIAAAFLIEEFLDKRDLSDAGQMFAALVAEMRAQAQVYRSDIAIVDTGSVQWRRDYDLGSLVTVRVDGVSQKQIVREIQITLGDGGDAESITPTVSSPTPRPTVKAPKVYNALAQLDRRLSSLEQSQ